MARRTNRTRFALLGMLSLGPRSGYGLKKEFESRVSYFWNESIGQIYPTLRQLEDEGLLQSEKQPQTGRPDQIVYRCTAAGRAVLREWMSEPPVDQPVRSELALKLFFASEFDAEVAHRHVEEFQSRLIQLRRLYGVQEKEIRSAARTPKEETYWNMSLRLGQRLNNARLAWCKEALDTLDELDRSEKRAARKPKRMVSR